MCIAEPRHGNIVARLQYEFQVRASEPGPKGREKGLFTNADWPITLTPLCEQINEMSWVPDHPGLIAHAGRDDEGGVLALTHWTGQALTPVAKVSAQPL